jgi:hypothetical protein
MHQRRAQLTWLEELEFCCSIELQSVLHSPVGIGFRVKHPRNVYLMCGKWVASGPQTLRLASIPTITRTQ